MTTSDKTSTFSIASIYAFRMLGLFIILPIFSLYADKIIDATPTLIGIALGIYGLTQALLQIVFGIMSDHYGRKPIIIFGLILFILGSIVCALSTTIYGIIIGRALQGAGAIGSTLTALVADVTKEENRMKAMSVVGMTIGFSFLIAIILGPILNNIIGLSGIFWLTAVLGVIAIGVLIKFVPTPKVLLVHPVNETVKGQIVKVLLMPELMRLNFGILVLHASLTALFIAVPIILQDYMGIGESTQWVVYLPVLLISFCLMIPFIIIAETKNRMKKVFVSAIFVLMLMQFLLFGFDKHIVVMSVLLVLFFASFTLLESSLPSLVSKLCPIRRKGTAMGIFSSFQFLGIFIGGALGGVIFHHFGVKGIFIFNGVLTLLWLIVAISMKKPKQLSTKIIGLKSLTEDKLQHIQEGIKKIAGVEEAYIAKDEKTAYLKVDKRNFDEKALLALVGE